MDKLISRQAAIDALVAETIYTEEELKEYYEANSHRNEWVNGIYEAIERIKQLPLAQPEIIRCRDCENYQTDWKPTACGATCGDLHYCAVIDLVMPPDGYCYLAERRTDG